MTQFPPFDAPYAEDDQAVAVRVLTRATLAPDADRRVDQRATRLIEAIRTRRAGIGGVEEILREYALSTKEGLALMVLAEALLRVPDGATADQLIEDKIGQGDFAHHVTKSRSPLVSASSWALGLSARIVQPGETPEGVVAQVAKRLGLPAIRLAVRQAMRVMGAHFVLGQTIEEALARAGTAKGRAYRYSFDMLGEGARTADDADSYYRAYAGAIQSIGSAAGNAPLPERPGISVKLSALHPRYEASNRDRVLAELPPKVIELARAAKSFDLNFTIDAEEADRLELSLDVIDRVAADPSLGDWIGFGLAIQAYQKRAGQVIDHVIDLARRLDRRFMVRLVKGAYWDSEVKRAQERGLDGYPVFTRKAMTDLNYIACARQLLDARPLIYPQFATHNALTIATIAEIAGGGAGYEFQRLHGMGDAAYAALLEEAEGFACRTYAPVGGHQDLLAYLVRRLLENGANSSFVSASADPAVPVADLLVRPAARLGDARRAANPSIPLPTSLYGPGRRNSRGVEFGHRTSLAALADAVDDAGRAGFGGAGTARRSPIDLTVIGNAAASSPADVGRAVTTALTGFARWSRTPAAERAAVLAAAADLLEAERPRFLALLRLEAGKTLDDGLAELREAVDFCRYYAGEARRLFAEPDLLPGPTGETNHLSLAGRGVFATIAPWNFPLAIFLGQTVAALAAGNSVVAKPAEQTPLIASAAVDLLHRAGLPGDALALVLGGATVGAALVDDPRIAGVAFTGSTATARRINRALAAKDGPIVPLIAETGGLNAMIVDATALPEQVSDDVITSAFRSAGQRCSALRLLCLQEDVADRMLAMIVGAARELTVGDPRDLSVSIGPVIDGAAKARLDAHIARMAAAGRVRHAGRLPDLPGHFVASHVIEIDRVGDLTEEHFGPILHVLRYPADALDGLLTDIAATGYGLTLGLHSRIETRVQEIVDRLPVGNIYVNRNMIGAVVGVQPFGGSGLSGTGPKAGGPHYLPRFATERTLTVNTAAAGGNATLMASGEDG